jgi:hypothetical protein
MKAERYSEGNSLSRELQKILQRVAQANAVPSSKLLLKFNYQFTYIQIKQQKFKK